MPIRIWSLIFAAWLVSILPQNMVTATHYAPEEIGSVEDVRYILSPELTAFENAGSGTLNGMISSNGSNTDVYPVIYVGKEAYGCTALKGIDSIEPTVINPGTPSKSDSLGQRGFVS